jgi:hypothetical protein
MQGGLEVPAQAGLRPRDASDADPGVAWLDASMRLCRLRSLNSGLGM